ncbi:MAG: (d)CMP kinase [Oscillospiraceae bacterium]|jgi:cytidylate kinase|nr:(d)CMP kinase [Oscillospiraceae bacterium]
MNHPISVAIDGPSAAGKSTLARMLAARLGFLYVDTGAIYRTVGLFVYRQQVNPRDEAAVSSLLDTLQIHLRYEDDGLQHMYLGEEDVSNAIREHLMSQYASDVSTLPSVRQFLLSMQRSLAASGNVVMDGRDIGTVVLPHADVKIFLTASAEERARRRFLELQERGEITPYETVLQDIRQRDLQDQTRATAPLKQAEDAVLIDSTHHSIEECLCIIGSLVKSVQMKPISRSHTQNGDNG